MLIARLMVLLSCGWSCALAVAQPATAIPIPGLVEGIGAPPKARGTLSITLLGGQALRMPYESYSLKSDGYVVTSISVDLMVTPDYRHAAEAINAVAEALALPANASEMREVRRWKTLGPADASGNGAVLSVYSKMADDYKLSLAIYTFPGSASRPRTWKPTFEITATEDGLRKFAKAPRPTLTPTRSPPATEPAPAPATRPVVAAPMSSTATVAPPAQLEATSPPQQTAEPAPARRADRRSKQQWQGAYSPLMQAAQRGDADEVQRMIRAGYDVNEPSRDGQGRLPLHMVAQCGGDRGLAAAKVLIEAGAEVDGRNTYLNGTALATAAANNAPEVAKYLLARGATVNAQDKLGRTPLDFAEHFNHAEVISVLKAAGGKAGSAKFAKPK